MTEHTARPLDDVDKAMLRVLCEDGRISMLELATRLGISRGNAYARFERLRRDGVLAGFTARIDVRRLGLTVAAFVNVRIEQQSWQTIRTQLLAIEEVEYAALTTGGSDFVVLVRAANVETLRDVVLDRLRSVPGVRSTYTTLILDEHPKQQVLP
ncbi:MAG TPA: Lrp/AsnC family transcriptional regulator [Actinomycetota bacterium]|jgi:DNA-binding Lrp family transcriptional regulator|nr:Lrp/AsnC family transcriptional regulator [Actinomycetota bacterium]